MSDVTIRDNTVYECVDVTSGRNGYPRDIRKATVFGSREEIEAFTDLHQDTHIRLLRRRDGWHCWETVGGPLYSMPDVTAEDLYGDDAWEVDDVAGLKRWLKDENRDRRACGMAPIRCSVDDIMSVSEMGDGVTAVFMVTGDNDGWFTLMETFRRDSVRWRYDVWTYMFAVMDDDDYMA